jgi:hypothetical protein
MISLLIFITDHSPFTAHYSGASIMQEKEYFKVRSLSKNLLSMKFVDEAIENERPN